MGYVVTNVKRPVSAPTGVDAYLTGNGYQVIVEWQPFSDVYDAPVGYYIYRSCDNQTPMQVNDIILPYTASSFVDSSTLRPGKIYTYYVAACYNNGNSNYLTMNSKSSTVVWGIPQLTEDSAIHVASMLGDGSFTIVIVMATLCVVGASLGIVVSKKK